MRRVTLALISTSYPISGDGSEAAGAFVADLVQALSKTLAIRVIAPGPRAETQQLTKQIVVDRFKAPETALSTLKPWRPDHLLKILGVLRGGQQALERAIHDGPVDHILALWALPSGHWARQASRRHGIPYSVWTLGSDIWSLGRIPLIRNHLQRVLRDAAHCYSDGFQLARDTEAIGKRPVDFLPSTRALNSQRTTAVRSHPPYRLVFIGRWHPNKGIDLLLTSLQRLTPSDWARIEKVCIFGGGPLRQQVQTQVADLQQKQCPVELGGYIDKAAAEQAISGADYLLIPSRIESIPVVFSDAIKLRTPVISMPVGDLADLLARGCGILSKAISVEAYTDALKQALRADASAFDESLQDTARMFSLSQTVVPQLIRAFAAPGADDDRSN